MREKRGSAGRTPMSIREETPLLCVFFHSCVVVVTAPEATRKAKRDIARRIGRGCMAYLA